MVCSRVAGGNRGSKLATPDRAFVRHEVDDDAKMVPNRQGRVVGVQSSRRTADGTELPVIYGRRQFRLIPGTELPEVNVIVGGAVLTPQYPAAGQIVDTSKGPVMHRECGGKRLIGRHDKWRGRKREKRNENDFSKSFWKRIF